jgi:cytochrome c556
MQRNVISIPILVLLWVLNVALAASCVPKPRMQYSNDQLVNLHETKELMRVLYHGLSPVWDSDKKSSYGPADFKTMARTAPRVVAISRALASKKVSGKFKEEFARRATELGNHAVALEKAAIAAQEPPARKAIKGINASCKSCHSKFR